MTTRLLNGDSAAFKIRRSVISPDGFTSDVDPLVRKHLQELDTLLGKKILPVGERARTSHQSSATTMDAALGKSDSASTVDDMDVYGDTAVRELLSLPLTPKKIPRAPGEKTSWANDSLAAVLSEQKDDPAKASLSDHIDQTPELAELKYSFLDSMELYWHMVSSDVRAALKGYPNLTDYTIAYSYHVRKISDVKALRNFITQNRLGARRIADYAVVSGARQLIDKEQLKVDHYNDDNSDFTTNLAKASVPLSALSYLKTVRAYIEEFVFDRDEEKLIKAAKIGPLPADIIPTLIKYIQNSPIEITKENAKHYLPNFVLQIMKMRGAPEPESLDDTVTAGDFQVQFSDDSADASLEVSKTAVKCAAQFYHAMVLGDELDVFGAVNYLTHKRLFIRGIRIESPVLRNDLKTYVFSNEFIDLKSGQRMDRTRPAERQMFHRQVFNQGHTQVPEDLPLNAEFRRLWKVLMLESARYLERAQASMHPESFVSPQNVMQAVEDLQYNLSASCTGMATVIAPVIDAELNFVLERILKHPEIVRQIVPEGGSWKQVVDKLNAEQRRAVGNAATLYNKARLGQGIIDAVADYTPAAFEDDGVFSAFISKVDAFITTQSILQRPKLAELDDEDEEDNSDEPHDSYNGLNLVAAAPDTGKPNGVVNGVSTEPAATDEWDF